MKAKVPKRHLKESDAPLLPGADQIAMCGEIVARASFPFMYEDALSYHFGEFLSALHVCATCWKTELAITNARTRAKHSGTEIGERYVYGLVAGQEEMDAERTHYAELIEAA
jgi:hypothetical protein